MTALAWLIPAALLLSGLGLAAFLWALRSGQFDDLEGAPYRALDDDPPQSHPSPPGRLPTAVSGDDVADQANVG